MQVKEEIVNRKFWLALPLRDPTPFGIFRHLQSCGTTIKAMAGKSHHSLGKPGYSGTELPGNPARPQKNMVPAPYRFDFRSPRVLLVTFVEIVPSVSAHDLETGFTILQYAAA
jgi:hypothetical protein